jgi:hypothetical protein
MWIFDNIPADTLVENGDENEDSVMTDDVVLQ